MARRDHKPVKWHYYEIPAEDVNPFEVYSWCPTPQPTVDPTQVHLHLPPMGNVRAVVRFKSPRSLDQLIEALLDHRKDVFGERTEADVANARAALSRVL